MVTFFAAVFLNFIIPDICLTWMALLHMHYMCSDVLLYMYVLFLSCRLPMFTFVMRALK